MPTSIVVPLAILAAFGLALGAWGYDRWITELEAAGHHHGYVSLLVVAGCSVILLVALAVVWPLGSIARLAVAITAGLFVPAGIPMMLGSFRRHVLARQSEAARLAAEARGTLR